MDRDIWKGKFTDSVEKTKAADKNLKFLQR